MNIYAQNQEITLHKLSTYIDSVPGIVDYNA